MGLLSIFKRSQGDGGAASESRPVASAEGSVQQARVRARRRLIGATVLVLTGIVGFPLVFESQPRPIPVDIPIDMPHADNAPPLAAASQRGVASPGGRPAANPPTARVDEDDIITEPAEPALAASAPASSSAATASTRSSPSAPAVATPLPGATSSTSSSAVPTAPASPPRPAPAAPAPDAARAQALLEGRPVASQTQAVGDRFVVQIGAFADAAAARETRAKAEKLGFKTYTQVAETPSGNRTRVRVGPLSSRDEADKVAARLRSAGLSGVVLTL